MNKFSIIISCLALILSIVAFRNTIDIDKRENVHISITSKEQDKVFSFVNNNLEIIKSDIEQNDFTKTLELGLIKSVQVKDNLIDFQCFETIDQSNNIKYGFFYTTEEDFSDAWGKNKKVDKISNLEDEPYEISKLGLICDSFYFYYSADFIPEKI